MKNLPPLTLAIIITTLLFSCRPDEYTEVGGEVIGEQSTTIVQSNLNGTVVNESNQAIANAAVTISGELTETDENGFYSFQNIDLSTDGSLLKISKDGYFDGFQFATGEAGKYSQTITTLVQKNEQRFQSSDGGTIVINGGSSIVFNTNSISHANGQAYQGEVVVYSHWYDPSSNELIYTMPGDLRGLSEENDAVQLQTYGMMAVELESPTGEELQLSNDQTATLMFPLTQGSDASSFESIPTWHLDEATGVWMEEGEAFVQGDFLVAEVSHFSFWNCDVPYPLINITGTLVSEDGLPLPFQTVVIKDNNSNVSRSGQTNELGFFRGKVPAGVDLTMYLFTCDENYFVTDLGVLNEDTDFGNIVFSEISGNLVTATLINCDQEPITSGYVKIITPNETKIVTTDANGELSYTLLYCDDTEVTLVAYDLNESKVSDEISFNTNQTIVDLATIIICEEITEEYIHYFINNETHNLPLNQFSIFYADDRMLYINAYAEYVPNVTGPNFLIIYDTDQEIAQYYVVGFKANNDWLATEGMDLEIDISGFSQEGDFISITFDNGVFRGDMSVALDKIVESGTVSGVVWHDENENGIRDAGEEPLEGKKMKMSYQGIGFPFDNYLYGTSYYPQPLNTPQFVFSDNNGNFTFTGVFVEEEIRVYYSGESGEELTIDNVGNDDSVDSDFFETAIGQYNSDTFILDNGGERTDIGLGLKL